MKTINQMRTFSVFLAALTVSGCAYDRATTEVDRNFGNAVRSAVAQQTINPDASLNRDPVAGIDGRDGVGAVDRYHQANEAGTASQTPTVNVNIGSPSGSTTSR